MKLILSKNRFPLLNLFICEDCNYPHYSSGIEDYYNFCSYCEGGCIQYLYNKSPKGGSLVFKNKEEFEIYKADLLKEMKQCEF